MRITPFPILWLATALSVGVASGDEVCFLQDAFTTGEEGMPVFPISAGDDGAVSPTTAKTFSWFVNQTVAPTPQHTVAVTQVNLCVSATTTPVASAFNTEGLATIQGIPTTTSAGGSAVTGSLVTAAPGGPADQHTAPTSSSVASYEQPVPLLAAAEVSRNDDTVSIRTLDRSDASSPAITEGLLSISNDSLTTGTVTVTDMAELLGQYPAELLYFELVWHDPTSGDGKSYSRYFALVSDTDPSPQLFSDPGITNDTPAMPEQTGLSDSDSDGPMASPTSVPGAASSISISPPVSSATAVEPIVGGGPSSTPPAAGHSSSSLSMGAIAGIAVAAALAGLAVLAGLLFLYLRRRHDRSRRRRRRLLADPAGGGGYASRGTPDLVAQKEAHAGVGVDVTPHSPYSEEDGGSASMGGLRNRGAVVVGQDEAVPLAGYGGHAVDAAVSRGSVAGEGASLGGGSQSLTAGRDTPTAVLHLVEEGMTEEEIRQLEEEERELDQAIEQAGGGTR